MATGFVAWKVAKGLYIVPFLFAYTPLLGGNFWSDLEVCFFAAFAIYAIAGALDGHLEAPVGWPMRAVLFAAGVALMWPNQRWVHLAGLAVLAAYLAANVLASRRFAVGAEVPAAPPGA